MERITHRTVTNAPAGSGCVQHQPPHPLNEPFAQAGCNKEKLVYEGHPCLSK